MCLDATFKYNPPRIILSRRIFHGLHMRYIMSITTYCISHYILAIMLRHVGGTIPSTVEEQSTNIIIHTNIILYLGASPITRSSKDVTIIPNVSYKFKKNQ